MTTYQKRKTLNLCQRCGKVPPAENKTRCLDCQKILNDLQAERRIADVASGLCRNCRKPSDGKKYCPACRSSSSRYCKTWAENNIAAGKCRCGKDPMDGKNVCLACVIKGAARDAGIGKAQYASLVALFERQHGKCPYSGRLLSLGVDAELDHIMPRSKGGPDTLENLQWVHAAVNRMKSDLLEAEFLNLVHEISASKTKAS